MRRIFIEVIKFFRALVFFPIGLMGWLIPKERNLVVFGAMGGKYFGDNSRYVFEVLCAHSGIRAVWITRSRNVKKSLSERGMEVIYVYSPLAIWTLLRAPVALFTNGVSDFSPDPFFLPARMRLIALRHGRSVKRIRHARLRHKIGRMEWLYRQLEENAIAHVISTSEIVSDMQEECLRIGRDKHIVTGYPRNDDLAKSRGIRRRMEGAGLNVLYAPSWRHGRESTRFFPFEDLDMPYLMRECERLNINLFLRPHKNDLDLYPRQREWLESLSSYENIHMMTHVSHPDVNETLLDMDALISDYSALYHDFLLLDRPIILIPYDIEEFSMENGFLYDYRGLAPGPLVSTMGDFVAAMQDLAMGVDNYSNRRKRLCDMIHHHLDDGSTRRVINLVKNMLGSSDMDHEKD